MATTITLLSNIHICCRQDEGSILPARQHMNYHLLVGIPTTWQICTNWQISSNQQNPLIFVEV